MDSARRRTFLRAVFGVGVVGAAGCSERTSRGSQEETEPASELTSPTSEDNEEPDDTDTDAGNTDDNPTAWPVAGRTPPNHTYVQNGGPGENLQQRWRWRIEPPDSVRNPEGYGDEYTFADYMYSAPVSDGDHIYLLVSGEARLNEESERDKAYVNRLVALNPKTGDVDWQTSVANEDDTPYPLSFSPAVQDERVVTVSKQLQAYGTDGEREWQVEYENAPGGPVIAAGSDVFLPTTEGLECYALADGSERWKALGQVNTAEVVAVADDEVYVPVWNEVVGLARTSGEELWRAAAGAESWVVQPGGRTTVGSPVVRDNNIYVACGFRTAFNGDSGALVALDRASGDERWRFRPTHPEADEPGPGSGIFGMPALADGTLYAAGATGTIRVLGPNDDLPSGWNRTPARDALYAIDADDGSLEWQAELPGIAHWIVGADGVVYTVTTEGKAAFLTEDGSEVATAPVTDTKGPAVGQPTAIIDDAFIVPLRQGIEAFA